MKYRILMLLVIVLVVSFSAFASNLSFFANRIEGSVYSPNRMPVENVYVELMNDTYSTLSRVKTTSSGRFSFSGLSTGKFLVKALPAGLPYLEQTQEVYIQNFTRQTSDIAYVDFYLVADKKVNNTAEKPPESIFVQEVPPAAQKLFEEGKKDLNKNLDTGFAKIEQSLSIFSNYFDALNLLGKEYVVRKNYEKAYPYMLKAIDINPRSFSNYFRLAYSFYQIKQYPAALEAARASTILVPDSIDAHQLYGTILRIDGRYEDAEKSLLKANALANGKNVETHWQLSLLYNRLNKNKAAIDELETVLKLAPDFPERDKVQTTIEKLKVSVNSPK
jgi:tetratricopeptide (TPR) repeat protein